MIYFRGWGGLGASAVLNLVAQRLKSSKRPNKFDKIIHVDCSVWKSMRALQKTIAEELQLPHSVMAIFDQCNEDDDFNGTDQGSRGVISHIRREIFRKLVNNTFVVVFHNGSRRYIDLYECGVPVISLMSNKVLWTWHGRFRLGLELEDGEQEKMKMQTDVDLRTSLGSEFTDKELRRGLMREEAEEVAKCTGIVDPDYMDQNVVKQCFWYAFVVKGLASFSGIDLGTHVSSYWICDGILQGQGDTSAWEIGDRLHRNMLLVTWDEIIDNLTDELYPDTADFEDKRWEFTTHKELLQDHARVLPPEATSFFLYAEESPINTVPVLLPVSLFQHSQSSKLRVLHLSCCSFSFTSPPFLGCSQLRLLHLDHCTDMTVQEHPSNENILCFHKLWVLSLTHTEWYWLLSEKMKRSMVDLRELNVEGVKYGSVSDLCRGSLSLVMLRVTEDQDTTNQEPPNMSNANNVVTSNLDNEVLSPSLESFSFIQKAQTAAKISSISFRGCSRLKNILLRGYLGSLEELDLSGTTVKTLDLREVEAPNLKRLILLGCEKLCAILWPPENKKTRVLKVLHINTIQSASPSEPNREESTKEASAVTRSLSIHNVATTQQGIGQTAPFDFNWYISVRDVRLLRSIVPLENYVRPVFVYMEMDSPPTSSISGGGSKVAQGIGSLKQPDKYLYASDAIFRGHLEAGAGNEGAISWMWACPTSPTPTGQDWYVHMQDEVEMKSRLLQQPGPGSTEETISSTALIPAFICDSARMMHVYDSFAITCIPCKHSSDWRWLKWCRVERCPKLHVVFPTPQKSYNVNIYIRLELFWASQLPMACYIWNWNTTTQPGWRSFQNLVFLHLDNCPRLIHVLPLSKYMATLPNLETLEIVCCGDLREVFPLDPKRQGKRKIIEFPKLRRIHMYELPKLQHICGSRMSAPNLETIVVRGCWSLRRLPAVSGNTAKRPKVDCEKDWWDNLDWEGMEANQDHSLYELTHSKYYKAQLSRGALLR